MAVTAPETAAVQFAFAELAALGTDDDLPPGFSVMSYLIRGMSVLALAATGAHHAVHPEPVDDVHRRAIHARAVEGPHPFADGCVDLCKTASQRFRIDGRQLHARDEAGDGVDVDADAAS